MENLDSVDNDQVQSCSKTGSFRIGQVLALYKEKRQEHMKICLVCVLEIGKENILTKGMKFYDKHVVSNVLWRPGRKVGEVELNRKDFVKDPKRQDKTYSVLQYIILVCNLLFGVLTKGSETETTRQFVLDVGLSRCLVRGYSLSTSILCTTPAATAP
ncbi:hypothetical protein RUM43_004786 [Polyplax serrata]|uniref:Uncharacterized protein n=1 Tax=Polyplax serrata TaxID=468196 RepID=A0AAN8SC31_POLSC